MTDGNDLDESLFSLPNATEINERALEFPVNPAFDNRDVRGMFPAMQWYRPDRAVAKPFSTHFVYPPMADNPPSPLERNIRAATESCFAKAIGAAVGGAGLGLAFGLFFGGYTNAVDKAVDTQGTTLVKLRVGAREAWAAMASYAKNFSRFGATFAITECAIERFRARHDMFNGTMGGCITGAAMASAPFQSLPIQARVSQMAIGCASIGLFSAAFEYYMALDR